MQNNKEWISNIIFEELSLGHINLLIDYKNQKYNSWFYKMAIINTFNDLIAFLINLEKTKNKCIIAIQKKKIIGFLYTYPLNEKKTCMKINTPNILDKNFSEAQRSLVLELMRKSISNTDLKTSSWLINAEINNNELISCARELGFQPLQEIKLLSIDNLINKNQKEILKTKEIDNFIPIDKSNIQKVLNYVRSNESILIRNILDFNQKDIYKRNDKFCGSIFSENEIIFTILKDINYSDEPVYSFNIDKCWDSRITSTLKRVLENIFFNNPKALLKTSSINNDLYSFLTEMGFMEKRTELILIRNNLIKREIKSTNKINNSLESIFDKINPNGNPFPSPFPILQK